MKKITLLCSALLVSALFWQAMAQSGATCDDPIVVTSMPFTESGNTSTYGDNYDDVPPLAPGAITNGSSSYYYYITGDEVVYSYTAGSNGNISISTTNDDDWIGLFALTGCPFESTVGYHTAINGTTRSIPDLPVIAGETYYIVISTWASPQSTNYTLNITGTDVADPPTCLKPTGLTADTITTTTADISWTAGDSETSWNISWGTPGYTVGGTDEVGSDTSSTESFQITDLSPSSGYQFYVQANCGGEDLSFWSGPISFSTACDAVSSLPYIENFDTYGTGSDAFPNCWERITYTSGSTVWPSIVSGNATSAPNSLKFQSNTGTPTYAISPPFEEDIQNLQVSFMLKREGTSSGTMELGVMSNPLDESTFEVVQIIDPANNDYTEYEFNLNNVTLSGGNNHIALRQNSASSVWYYWLDDFKVQTIPTCPKPIDLMVDSVETTTADVSWTAGNTETSWNISWGTPGFTVGGTGELGSDTSSTASFQITDLSPSSAYEFYVQAVCGSEDLSYWSGPVGFSTACDAITSLPYLENFDTYGTGSDAFPNCWERITYTSGSTVWPSIVAQSTAPSAPNSLKFQSSTGIPTYAISPPFEEDIQNLQVKFMLKREGTSSGTMELGVMSNPLDESTFEVVQIIDPANNDYTEYEFNLNNVTLSGGNNYIGLRQNSASSVWYYWLDDFKVQEIPTCPKPTNLLVDSVETTTADVSWTAGNTEASWNISWGTPGFTVGGTGELGSDTSSTESFQITDLSPSSAYEFYVQAVCGSEDLSIWSGPVGFSTACDAITSLPYLENFDTYGTGSDAFPNCWERITYTSGTVWPSIVSGNATSAPNSLKFQSNTGIPTYAISPPFVEDIQNLQVSFMLKREGTSSGTMELGVMSNPLDTSTFEVVQIIDPANNDYTEYEFNLNNVTLSGGNNYIALRQNSASSVWYYWLDDFMVQEIPTCPKPTNLLVDSVETTTADVSWTAGSSETSWNISWGTPGFTVGGTGELGSDTSSTASFQITDLSPSSAYEFYVQAVCGSEDLSIWSGPVGFSTACDAITTLPYLENFDTYGTGSEAFPNCWERITYTSGTVWPSIVSGNATSAPNSLKFQSNTGIPTYAISPPFEEDIQNLQVTFMLRREGTSSGTMELGVMSNPLDTSTFELVQTINPTNNDYTEYEINLNNVTLSGGNNYIALRQNSTSSIWYYWLDDFMVQEIPTCPRPTDLVVDSIESTTADISWTPGSSETEWNVIYGLAGFNPEIEGTTLVVNDDPNTTLTDLETDTAYEYYVRAICGVDDESTLSNVKYFFTGYCEYVSTSTTYYITDFYTEEGVSNITNMNSGQSPNGYGNFTAMEVVTFPTGEFNFTANFNGTSTYGFNMWIDFNGNMEFEESEKVYASGAYVTNVSGTITIPLVTENGNYRMRIVADYLSTNPTACGPSNYAEAEDYTVVIINAPTCFPPRDLVVEGVTETTADVSWTPQDDETEWDVIYGAPGFDPETGGTTQNVTGGIPEATITGLNASTEYEFYVRAKCGVDDESILAGPASFITECVVLDLPYTINFESGTPPNLPICTSVENVGNGNEWETAYVNGYGFSGKSLRYKWNSQSAANTWFYTQGLNLTAGVDYQISYKYGNSDSSSSEKLKVAFGSSPAATYMTNELADYSDITGGMATEETIVFTAPADGVYYFGFNAHSDADQFYLFVDDIHIRYAADCDPVTNVEVTNITNTTVTASWTASPTATDGYTMEVYLEGANPTTTTPEKSVMVEAGVTEATANGLTPDTSYDVYIVSDCGGGNIVRSQKVNFVTTYLGLDDNNFTQINYYPNPVKDQLTITAATSIENVTVYNLLGQTVMQIEPRDLSVVLNMSTLPTGTYVLKATVETGASTFKVVKE